MKRIPLLLLVLASVAAVASGSALATAARTAAASPPVNTTAPTIAGTAQDGQTLTAGNGTWTGTAPIAYAYQWQRCNSGGSGCSSISKATNQNYVLSHGDVAHTARVSVTATNVDGKTQALSAATAVIASVGSAPVNTTQPNPSGTATVGQTVKVDNGKWSGATPITFTYQWQSCTAVNPVCADIVGATSSSYVIATTLVGSKLRATVTGTNSVGKASASSNLTATVAAKAGAPVNSSLPVITGSPTVGQTVQASTGTWTDVAANGFTYQWSRCNADGSACSSISGATGQSYGVGQADVGLGLRVTVTAKNATGSTSAISATTAAKAAIVTVAKFNAVLRAGQEVTRPHGTSSRAAGHFTASLNGKTLTWTLTFAHLSGRPTVTGLNKAIRSTTGAAFKTLCRSCISTVRGTLTLTASQRDAMLRGGTYINIHTKRNVAGEIRGQIARVS